MAGQIIKSPTRGMSIPVALQIQMRVRWLVYFYRGNRYLAAAIVLRRLLQC